MTTAKKECFICGCTEDRACMTPEGPCSWAFEDRRGLVCSACIIRLPPGPKRERFPDCNIIIEKLCETCSHLIEDKIGALGKIYGCEKGKFGENQWFALSGIKRRNKTVREARRNCKGWELHPKYRPGDESTTSKEV